MKKISKVFAFIMAILMCVCMFGGITVYADKTTNNTENNELATLEGFCLVTVKLKDFDTDETDNIILQFKDKKTGERKQTTFTKENKWIATVYLAPGKHEISFYSATNKREIEITEEVLNVADAKTAAVELNVKKVIDNRFFPKFFRNNTFTLILLVVSSICYFIFKKRREMGIK